jgi:hypothetical protein
MSRDASTAFLCGIFGCFHALHKRIRIRVEIDCHLSCDWHYLIPICRLSFSSACCGVCFGFSKYGMKSCGLYDFELLDLFELAIVDATMPALKSLRWRESKHPVML